MNWASFQLNSTNENIIDLTLQFLQKAMVEEDQRIQFYETKGAMDA
jgi:hypothetical protein